MNSDLAEYAVAPSQQQRDFWLLHRLATGASAYNVSCSVHLDGELDIPALRRAAADTVAAEAQLRASFHGTPDGDLQVLIAPVNTGWSDIKVLPPANETNLGTEALRAAASVPFDLSTAPLIRLRVLPIGHGYTVMLASHHLALDGNGVQRLLVDLIRRATGSVVEPPAAGYDVYVAQQTRLAGIHGAADRQFWRTALQSIGIQRDVLPVRPPNSSMDPRGAETISFQLPTRLRAAISDVSVAHRVTPFMILLAAAALVSHRHGHRDLVCGVPVDLRGEATAAGTYTVTLPATLSLSQVGVTELLRAARVATLQMLEHPHVSIRELMEIVPATKDGAEEQPVLPWSLIVNWLDSPRGATAGEKPLSDVQAISTGLKSAIAISVHDHDHDHATCFVTFAPRRYHPLDVRRWCTEILDALDDLCHTADMAMYKESILELWDTVWDTPHDGVNIVARAGSSTFTESEVEAYRNRVIDLVNGCLDGEEGRVLEIGCGNGQLTTLLAPEVSRLVSCDPSRTAVKRVSDTVAARHPHVVVIESFAHDVAGQVDGPFDVILLAGVIQFFPDADYLDDVLDNLSDLLAPGGALVLADVVNKDNDQFAGAFKLDSTELQYLASNRYADVDEVTGPIAPFPGRYDLVLRHPRKIATGLPDRPAPVSAAIPPEPAATETTESRLRHLVADVLGRDIDPGDNFFDSGGDSVSAANLLAHIKRAFSVHVRLVEFFANSTVEYLVRRVEASP